MMVMLFVAAQVLGLGMQAGREKFAAGQGKEDVESVNFCFFGCFQRIQ